MAINEQDSRTNLLSCDEKGRMRYWLDWAVLSLPWEGLAGAICLCKQKRRTARRYGVKAVLLLQDA
jgi:hypothetical protein